MFENTRIGVDEYFRPAPRAVIAAPDGLVWTSSEGGSLYCFDPVRETLSRTELRPPGVPGRQFLNLAGALAAAWGKICGGGSDGYSFEFDPVRRQMASLGRAIDEPRIRALTVDRDGALWGVAGPHRSASFPQ